MRGELGAALRDRLHERRLLQSAAAVELGTTQQTLSKWMNGIHAPSETYVPALARFLDRTEGEVRAMLPPRERAERMTAGRRLIDLEDRVDRLALRVASLAERVERLADRPPARDD